MEQNGFCATADRGFGCAEVSQAWAQTHGSKAHGKPSAPSVPFCSFPTALRAEQGRCIIGQVFPEANTARRTVTQG